MAGKPMGWAIPFAYDAVEVAANRAVGFPVWDDESDHFIMAKGVASLASGDAVTIEAAFALVRATKAQIDKLYSVGAARAGAVAAEFCFVQVYGLGKGGGIKTLASAAAEVAIYSSATAGSVDDDATAQTKILRLFLTTATGGSAAVNAATHLMYPSA